MEPRTPRERMYDKEFNDKEKLDSKNSQQSDDSPSFGVEAVIQAVAWIEFAACIIVFSAMMAGHGMEGIATVVLISGIVLLPFNLVIAKISKNLTEINWHLKKHLESKK